MSQSSGPQTPQGVPYATLPHLVNAHGQHLFRKDWEPTLQPGQSPRALVFLSHGFKQNCLQYDEFAKQMATCGLKVFSHDHVGHGQSQGYRADVTSFDVYVDDVIQHVCQVRRQHPGIPVFCVGHSMGALVTILVSLKRPDLLAGVVCTGASLRANGEPVGWQLLCLKVLAYFYPLRIIPGTTGRRNPATRNPEKMDSDVKDPLNRHEFGNRFRVTVEGCSAIERAVAGAASFTSPVLLLHGGDDPMVPPAASTHFYEIIGSEDKQIKMYPGLSHEIIHELPEDAAVVRKDIIDWIIDRLPSS
ncbi:MGLL [Branchiostoma lanceolatum]|uniref:MGLL protein n=1 Tax=Branchiostoma lanceolatum TaxID=7740 RepID=A0A8J9ZWQ9_BRALA|nr:MGLL [Branchiostoma lanceolatum]